MNQREAFKETVALMEANLPKATGIGQLETISLLPEELKPQHIRDMAVAIEQDSNPQHDGEGFSEAKLGRWLGWAQAAVVAMGLATLEDMKQINIRWSGK